MSFRKLRRKFSVKYQIPHCKHNADYMVDKSQINLSGIKRSCLFITARNSRCSVDQGLFVARGLLHLLFRVLRILRTVMDCSGCPNFWVGANRTDTWFQHGGRSSPLSSIYISGVRSSGHRVKPNMAAMEALSYVVFSSLTRSFMFTCYAKNEQGDWNRRNSGPPWPPYLASLFAQSVIFNYYQSQLFWHKRENIWCRRTYIF